MVGFNFAPNGWTHCDGHLLPISSYEALFNLIGTTYGGNGQTTFAVPDLRGRVPLHMGAGPGLTPKQMAQKTGAENVVVAVEHLPPHTHQVLAAPGQGNLRDPSGAAWATEAGGLTATYSAAAQVTQMAAGAIGHTGGGQSHENTQPFTCVNFIIALYGIYPPRG